MMSEDELAQWLAERDPEADLAVEQGRVLAAEVY